MLHCLVLLPLLVCVLQMMALLLQPCLLPLWLRHAHLARVPAACHQHRIRQLAAAREGQVDVSIGDGATPGLLRRLGVRRRW